MITEQARAADRLLKAALEAEAWLGANCGDTADWPSRGVHVDNTWDAEHLVGLMTELSRAAQSYRATGAHGRMVASFRLPVASGGLMVLSDWLRKQYGDGLLMRQQGEFILIEEPGGNHGLLGG